jgi:D-3-phosphoglycerate dehydrogenase / 2-oxoglutarate reductase
MSKRKCLVIDSMHPSLFDLMKQTDWEIFYQPDITRGEIKNILNEYEGLIVRSKTQIDQDLLGDRPSLKFIGRAGAGLDNLDMDFIKSKDIAIVHAAAGNRDAVGEFTVGLLLSVLRNIPKANSEVRELIWEREGNRGEELMGKTVAIIGYGNMGKSFAKRLAGFGCKILAFDKYKRDFSDPICAEAKMEQIFAEADVLSLHIPLTSETRNLVNAEYISHFRKNIVLINTARGEIVPLKDLAEAIQSGKIRGAGLDVLENEKLQTLSSTQLQYFNLLKAKHNVIFTPHIAGWTFESHEKINVALVDQIKRLSFK